MLCELCNLSDNLPQAWPEIPLLFSFLALTEKRQTLLFAWWALGRSRSPDVMSEPSLNLPKEGMKMKPIVWSEEREEGSAHPSSVLRVGWENPPVWHWVLVHLFHGEATCCKEGSPSGQTGRRLLSTPFITIADGTEMDMERREILVDISWHKKGSASETKPRITENIVKCCSSENLLIRRNACWT